MSTSIPSIPSPARSNRWLYQVSALCILLGGFLALSVKTQQQAALKGVPTRNQAVLGTALAYYKQQNLELQKERDRYKNLSEKLAAAPNTRLSRELAKMLQDEKMRAGAVPVSGPGVVVTLSDNPRITQTPDSVSTKDVAADQLHAQDVRDVINELFGAGAEAVAVCTGSRTYTEQVKRFISTSAVTCSDTVVKVDGVPFAAPMKVMAIGQPDNLERALTMFRGPVWELYESDMMSIEKQQHIEIPAYSGSNPFKWARPRESARER